MKKIALISALSAVMATAAVADNNDIWVNQMGNGNVVGDALNPVTQIGGQNDMRLTQGGDGNAIGSRSLQESPAPTWPGATQLGYSQNMVVTQPGNRNTAELLRQKGGWKNDMYIRQSGNDNRIVEAHQHGDQNTSNVVQSGNRNFGNATQVGGYNVLEVLQSGNDNDYDVWQGGFASSSQPDACQSCDILIRQGGNHNSANVWQQDTNQMAQVIQSGNGNSAYTKQMR